MDIEIITTEDLESAIRKAVGIDPDDDRVTIEIKVNETSFEIRFERSDEYVTCNFSEMKKLSELFGTDSIDVGDQWKAGGCETCDFGARYSITYWIGTPKLRVVDPD